MSEEFKPKTQVEDRGTPAELLNVSKRAELVLKVLSVVFFVAFVAALVTVFLMPFQLPCLPPWVLFAWSATAWSALIALGLVMTCAGDQEGDQ